mmetsp:Transcript_13093/g.29782  ORF Transcript_13093/g.29782 Transcript_13093/m.29782 type:complete len:292 (+) Transcript_13093:59-934(+)
MEPVDESRPVDVSAMTHRVERRLGWNATDSDETWTIRSWGASKNTDSHIVTTKLASGLEDLKKYWADLWEEPATAIAGQEGRDEFLKNFTVLQTNLGATLMDVAVDEVKLVEPQLLILIIGSMPRDVAQKLFGKIDKESGDVWHAVLKLYKQQEVSDQLLENYLATSLDSTGLEWDAIALGRFAQNLPGGEAADKDNLRRSIARLAGRKKGLLVLNERLKVMTAGCTVQGLQPLPDCHKLAEFIALKLNDLSGKDGAGLNWSLIELSSHGLLLWRPSPGSLYKKKLVASMA